MSIINIRLPKDPMEAQLCREILIEMVHDALDDNNKTLCDERVNFVKRNNGFYLRDYQYLYYDSESKKRIREYKIEQILK